MSERAGVESVEALSVFRLALVKFQEAAHSALGDAESDIQRTILWLDNDQYGYWTNQIRVRQDAYARALEALRQKQIFRDSTGRVPSAVEEQRAADKARARLEEGRQKLAATKQWSKQLQREALLYKGLMQRFVTAVSADVPAAISHLGALIHALEAYTSLDAKTGGPALDPALAAYFSASDGGAGGSMARAQPAEPAETREEKKETKSAPVVERKSGAE